MASVQRLSLSQIETEILRITGHSTSALAPWTSSANLYLRVNEYVQGLPTKLAHKVMDLRTAGKAPPSAGVPRWDMWRTEDRLQTKATVGNVMLPEDYDHWISVWNETSNRRVDVVESVAKYHDHLKKKPAGPVEAIEIMGGLPGLSTPKFVRYANLYPVPATDQALTLTYWRIPRAMPGSAATTEYPDIDPKWEYIVVCGSVVNLLRPNSGSPYFDRYAQEEERILTDIALTAKVA